MRLLSEWTVGEPQGRAPDLAAADRLAPPPQSLPWNLADPVPQDPIDAGRLLARAPSAGKSKPSRAGRTRTATNGPWPPAITTPAPRVPVPTRPRTAERPATAGAARSGRPLSSSETHKATYLKRYLGDASAPLPAAKPLPSRLGPDATITFEERLKRAFLLADADGSHTVGKRECVCPHEHRGGSPEQHTDDLAPHPRTTTGHRLRTALEQAGLTAISSSEGLRLFQEADRDGDGQLTLDEFATLARRLRPLMDLPLSPRPEVPHAKHGLPAAADHLNPKTRSQLRKAFVSPARSSQATNSSQTRGSRPAPRTMLYLTCSMPVPSAQAAFDLDKTGWISIADLSGALRACGMSVCVTS